MAFNECRQDVCAPSKAIRAFNAVQLEPYFNVNLPMLPRAPEAKATG